MKINQADSTLLNGDPAVATFEMMSRLFTDLRPVIERAKLYSRSSSPILIEASAGPELEMLAQSIHNYSDRKKNAYSVITLSGTTTEEQEHVLFGNPKTGNQGVILDCNHGTLLLQGIDKLTLPMQAQLARVIRTKRVMSQINYTQYKYVDIRLIASTSKNLTELRNHFLFRSDLLFTFRALRLRIPRLRERPNDVANMLDFYFSEFNEQYGGHLTLPEEVRKEIISLPWESNITQLRAFCERMVLTAPSASISTGYVRDLFEELYQKDSEIYDGTTGGIPSAEKRRTGSEKEAVAQSDLVEELIPKVPESNDIFRDLIVSCLRKNNGNRRKTAADLGISTTTLWRKIRYYHLENY